MKTLLLLLSLISSLSFAAELAPTARQEEMAPLDKPYRGLRHPEVSLFTDADESPLPARSNLAAMLEKQTPVKHQEARGSCSIFSAAALLESMLLVEGKTADKLDLSEEWLQYLIAQWATNDGSTSPRNFAQIHLRGMPGEDKLPYVGVTWKSLSDLGAQARCAHVEASRQANCLTGHRDVGLLKLADDELAAKDAELLAARRDAAAFKEKFLTDKGDAESGVVGNTNEIKALLARGIPLTLDITFFYGAWNHRLAEELGINRDLANWGLGIVGYPEHGSVDASRSWEKPAGHSVVIVGYDDEREVEFEARMRDGTVQKFKRKGVYYIKNSWGTGGFGADLQLEGQRTPGYGMITQDYAHEWGQFFRLAL